MSDQGPRLSEGERQRLLEAAVARGGPAAVAGGAAQPELRTPLTDAELEAGGGYVVGITSVDMTPRPRYRETRENFERRMVAMGMNLSELRRDVQQRNRQAALRQHADGERYWTACSCGWHGLQTQDPEVARREYDAHDCAAAGVGQSAVDRAIAETDRNVLVKRTKHVLKPALAPLEREDAPIVSVVEQDGAEQRFALLELK